MAQRREPLPQVVARVALQCTARERFLRRERCLINDKKFLDKVEAKNVTPVEPQSTHRTSFF